MTLRQRANHRREAPLTTKRNIEKLENSTDDIVEPTDKVLLLLLCRFEIKSLKM